MRNYIRKTVGLDPERGDALTLRREEIGALYVPNFPTDVRMQILDTAGKWFCDPPNTPTPHLDNPLADAFLQTIISRQKKKVGDYIAGCDAKVYHKGGGNMGQHEVPHVSNINQSEENDNKGKSFSSVGGADRDGLTPPDCPPLSVNEAKKILAMDAPSITSHAELLMPSKKGLSAIGYKVENATADALIMMVADKLHPSDIDTEDEAIASIIDGTGYIDDGDLPASFYKTAGGKFVKSANTLSDEIYEAFSKSDENNAETKATDVFKRALADAHLSAIAKNANNPAAWIIARLNKVLAAVRAIERAKDAAQENATTAS